MDTFSPVLLRISGELSQDNVKAMKFLCTDIGKKRLEKISSGIELFECLREMSKIGPDDTQFLKYLLNSIKRLDLLEILTNFEECGPVTEEVRLDPHEQANLDIAIDELSEQLAKNWRRYGRKLGITDAKLEQIETKHPFDLRERTVTLLREWRKMRGTEAKVDVLIQALRSCDLNLTADLLTNKLKKRDGQD